MSEDIRKMIDKVNNFDNEVDSGVRFVYDKHPELNSIGTPQQYSEYLKTIFPNSKVKDILYHGTRHEFDKFSDNPTRKKFADKDFIVKQGVFLTNNSREENVNWWGPNTLAVKINVSNPKAVTYSDFERGIFPEGVDLIYGTFDINKPITLEKLLSLDGGNVAVISANKTHILGSKYDIEMFKNFMKK